MLDQKAFDRLARLCALIMQKPGSYERYVNYNRCAIADVRKTCWIICICAWASSLA